MLFLRLERIPLENNRDSNRGFIRILIETSAKAEEFIRVMW